MKIIMPHRRCEIYEGYNIRYMMVYRPKFAYWELPFDGRRITIKLYMITL